MSVRAGASKESAAFSPSKAAVTFASQSLCGEVFESSTSLAFAMAQRMGHEQNCEKCDGLGEDDGER